MNTTLRLIPEADPAGSRWAIPLREAFAHSRYAPASAGRRSRLLRRAGLVACLGLLLSWRIGAGALLVWPDSPNPTAPYTDWATAARTFQDAVDEALPGDTVPTNTLSVLRLLTPVTVRTNLIVSWESVAGRTCFLERAADLGGSPAFLPLAVGIPGQPGTTAFTDTNALSLGRTLYRVGIQP
jgi:hypothetical protein